MQKQTKNEGQKNPKQNQEQKPNQTKWHKILPEKLTVIQLIKKLPACGPYPEPHAFNSHLHTQFP
jgi:hypothetical protein